MGLLVITGKKYAKAGRESAQVADLYLQYQPEQFWPAHVFFETLSESFWASAA
jgi:hypothetical protein